MTAVVVLLFGLLIGSFLNVVIIRLPGGRSIVSPPSHCPRCNEPIRPYDNIPVISYLMLRGKCRRCGQPISWRYPLVELMNGLLFVWSFETAGLTGEGLLLAAFCSSLLVITFIDLDHQIIPDVITLPGVAIGLLAAPFFLEPLQSALPFGLNHILPSGWPVLAPFLNAFIGMLCGSMPLLAIGWLWEKLRKIEAMGGGDVKLMAMVGAFLGWKGALLTIMLGSLTGALVGGLLILIKGRDAGAVIPFGPFLSLGAFTAAFFGPELIGWYLNLIRL